MRVELLYAPGCSSYLRAVNTLETVIAEEGLPVPIELIEEENQIGGAPTIRIDGSIHSSQHHLEPLREALRTRWREITEHPLLGAI